MSDNIIRESANCFLFARCLLKLLYVEVNIRIQNDRFVVEAREKQALFLEGT